SRARGEQDIEIPVLIDVGDGDEIRHSRQGGETSWLERPVPPADEDGDPTGQRVRRHDVGPAVAVHVAGSRRYGGGSYRIGGSGKQWLRPDRDLAGGQREQRKECIDADSTSAFHRRISEHAFQVFPKSTLKLRVCKEIPI